MLCKACFRPSLCVFHPIWVGGGLPRGLGHNLLVLFSCLGSSKTEPSETYFFDTLTIQNDQISYVKPVLPPSCVSHTISMGGLWGGGGGLPSGLGHSLLRPFSGLISSQTEISETDFLIPLTIKNDQMSYVKHVLANTLLCVFHLIRVLGGGGGSQGF